MTRNTIAAGFIKTISWVNNAIVDWGNGGARYFIDGSKTSSHRYYPFAFDGCINTADGRYAFIYQKLGTKGMLIKDGELLREINRSNYCANAYEYPAAFTTINDVTYLIHCPTEYCRLDFENVETGELVTDIPGRSPLDYFHSRLEISADNSLLMSKGWVWHPVEVIKVYSIKDCIENPLFLDDVGLSPDVDAEICTASFMGNTKVLIGSSDEMSEEEEENSFPIKHIAVWNIETGKISKPVKVNGEFGNLFAINEHLAWDTYLYPKIIDLKTGEIVDKDESIYSGKQKSSIVIKDDLVQIVFNKDTGQLAIINKEAIEILTP